MERIRLWLQRFPWLTNETVTVAVKAALLVLATVVVFNQDLIIVFTDAVQSDTTSYILAVPFLIVYLVYRKRKMLRAVIPLKPNRTDKRISLGEIIGALLFLASFLTYWYGSYTFTPLEYHILAMPLFTAACILILFNTQTLRQVAFPLVFMFLLVPPPAEILYYAGAILSTTSAEAAYGLLKLFGFPVSLSAEYETPVITVTQPDRTSIPLGVDVACSGIYSQIGFFVFAMFIAYIVRDKKWKKATIFLLGFPLIYFLNVIRITTIGAIAYYHGEALALNLFHLLGGWILIFMGTLILLVVSEKLLKIRIFEKNREQCKECSKTMLPNTNFCLTCGRIQNTRFDRIRKKDITKMTALILCVFLILSIQTPVFALTEGPAEIILQTAKGDTVTTQILPQNGTYTSEYSLHFMYRDTDFENRSKQDASLVYAYFPRNETKEIIWVAIEIASAKSSLHRWETCLITWPLTHGYQPKVTTIKIEDVQLLQNPPILGRYFIFQNKATNTTQAVLYWFETSIFKVNQTSQQKQVKISVIAYPDSSENLPDVENQLLTLAIEITGHWQAIKTWSQIALLISQNGNILITITITLLGFAVVLHFIGKRKERRQNTIAYLKLSKKHKQIINAVHQTQKNTQSTLQRISETYQKNTGKTLNSDELMQKLVDVEKIGIVKREIANKQDEPIQTWKLECSLPNK